MWLWWFNISFNAYTVWLTFLSLVTTVGFALLGYFINEFFDKASDAKAGKINKLAFVSGSTQCGIFIGSLLLTFLPWVWLPSTLFSWCLITTQVGFFLMYSLPFPRFKEHTYLSLIIDASYAYVVPLLLSFYTFSLIAEQPGFPLWFYLFSAAVFFIGIRNIIIHQVNDVFKDAQTGMRTLPMVLGVSGTKKIVQIIWLYESFLWLIFCLLLFFTSYIFFIYIIAYCIVSILFIANFFFNQRDLYKQVLIINHGYMYLYPIFMLFLLANLNLQWWILIPFHLIFLVPHQYPLKAYHIAAQCMHQLHRVVVVHIRGIASKLVNYPIYHAFKMAGIDLIKENKTAADVLFKRKRK